MSTASADAAGPGAHRRQDLGGTWLAIRANEERRRHFPTPDLDERGWSPLTVPGHWQSSEAFATSDGPLLYRHRFEAPAPPPGRRAWLELAGLFYQGDVWLDGWYLGDTEGYFAPHHFEVTERLREEGEHLLAVEVACTPPTDRRAKRNILGIFDHWDCIDDAWNPGGIWAPVTLTESGPTRITSLLVTCRDANAARATLNLEIELDAVVADTTQLTTVVTDPAGTVVAERSTEETLAAGANRVRWSVTVDDPQLWWPHALGDQPLHTVTVSVGAPGSTSVEGSASDVRRVVTGLRQVRMRDFILSVNGERLYVKGANCGPTRRALAEATPAELAADVEVARRAGLDLLRVHAHITRPELYEAADRTGMLLWQDLPLQWGYARIRRQAARQARQAVHLLGHHPSIAVWCGHNEPLSLDVPAGEGLSRADRHRFLVGQALPSFNKTALDRTVRRALDKADGSRPTIAHSGVLPHPAGGTDSHLYQGWYHGDERDLPKVLARLPVLGRFVSEFGAQAVPTTAGWMHPERWPDLDWDDLGAHHGLQRAILDQRVPADRYATFEAWQRATQAYQATVVRYHVETLRRLKYRPTGGFCVYLLADAQPAVSWSLLDHERVPKAAYEALTAACAPVIVVADRPDRSYRPGGEVDLAVHVVNDRHDELTAEATARLRWPGGERTWRWEGVAGVDSVTHIGRVRTTLPGAAPAGRLDLDLDLTFTDASGRQGRTSASYDAAVTPAS